MTGTKDIKDFNNGSTLAELSFKNNETLGAFRKSNTLVQKATLVEDDRETGKPRLSEVANIVGQEIFDRYCSTNEDGLKIMNIQNLVNYTAECTATKCDDKDHRVVDFLKKYDLETRGYVLPDDLKQFYVDAVVKGSELTLRNNLENLGYGPNLKKLPVNGRDTNS
jgi:hypothetical protein